MKNLTLKSYHTSEIPKIAETETRIWGTSTFFMTIYSCANIYSIGKKKTFFFGARAGCGSTRTGAGSGVFLLNTALSSSHL